MWLFRKLGASCMNGYCGSLINTQYWIETYGFSTSSNAVLVDYAALLALGLGLRLIAWILIRKMHSDKMA